MKTCAKVAIGFGAVLVLLCVLSGAALVSSGKLNQISGFAGNIMGMKSAGEGMEKLAREFPFTPPADGNVPEARLDEKELKAASEELSPNAKLYLNHEQALKECALGEQTSLLLNNSGARGRRRERG